MAASLNTHTKKAFFNWRFWSSGMSRWVDNVTDSEILGKSSSFETSGSFNPATRCNLPGHNQYQYCRNQKSRIFFHSLLQVSKEN